MKRELDIAANNGHEDIAEYFISLMPTQTAINSCKESIIRAGFLALYLKILGKEGKVSGNDVKYICEHKQPKFIKYFKSHDIPFRNLSQNDVITLNDIDIIKEYSRNSPLGYLSKTNKTSTIKAILESAENINNEQAIKILIGKKPDNEMFRPFIEKLVKGVSKEFLDGITITVLRNGFSPIFPFINVQLAKGKIDKAMKSHIQTLKVLVENNLIKNFNIDMVFNTLNTNKILYQNDIDAAAKLILKFRVGKHMWKKFETKVSIYCKRKYFKRLDFDTPLIKYSKKKI